MDYNRILIVTGGSIADDLLKKYADSGEYRYILGVDRGLEAIKRLGIITDYAIGDFDSASAEVKQNYNGLDNTIILNPEKDYTDTHVAVLKAKELNADYITILGGTGSRLDHVLGNFALLKICLMLDIKTEIIDTNNRIVMIDKEYTVRKTAQYGKYVSLIPFSDKVTGINTRGFKYELHNATLVKEETIGISNELREEEGHISIEDGYLMILETKD